MPITADYHLHSHHSGDSEAKMELMVQAAIQKGLTHICFTEHNDFDYPAQKDEDKDLFLLNTDSYLYELLGIRGKYEDKIRIGFGVELGLQKECVRKNLIFARGYEYDFIIASSHVANGLDPYYGSFYEGRSVKEANQEFFISILENLKLIHNFDVCGHLDYVVRYAPDQGKSYNYMDYMDIFDEIFKFLIENEKGLECNTGGYRAGLNMINPHFGLLKRYRELGGELITIGSDAHTPDYVGDHFKEAETFLKEAGFKYYSIYENRIAEYKKLI